MSADYTPTTNEIEFIWNRATQQRGVFDLWLAAHDAEVTEAAVEEQRQVDLAMHEAYRPEVVAEIAVPLGEDADWERIAKWCGGTIESSADMSGEWSSAIRIPGVGDAWEGSWIVQRHDLTFAIRAVVEGPSVKSVEVTEALRAEVARLRLEIDRLTRMAASYGNRAEIAEARLSAVEALLPGYIRGMDVWTVRSDDLRAALGGGGSE
ncbi:hypothetical protein [Actinotalea sp.]|uniref:hypothetical protein n=1 Tax=Actinotalea sp. TaxID=1872145 RepID=UPI00356212A0